MNRTTRRLLAISALAIGGFASSACAALYGSDGRYHGCGIVTEDGVTEYIDAYIERCGDTTLGGE